MDETEVAHHQSVTLAQQFAWRVHGPRRCIGIYNGKTERRQPCSRRAEASDGSQCAACLAADPGRLIAQDRTSPPGTFRTYLALFGRDTVKVGLTAERRADDRLLEQAAAAHVFISSGSYYDARQTELRLSSGLGLTQQLSWRRKRELWSEETEADQRLEVLAAKAADARNLLGHSAQVNAPRDESVVDDAAHYGLPGGVLPRQRRVPTVMQESDAAAGTVVGVLGKLLVLDDGHGCLVLDTRALEGWTVTNAAPTQSTHFAVAPSVELSVQQESLFSL